MKNLFDSVIIGEILNYEFAINFRMPNIVCYIMSLVKASVFVCLKSRVV